MTQHKTFVLWLTGMPAAGKTTLGKAICQELKKYGHKIHHLDGDEVRAAAKEKLGYNKKDRDKNISLAIDLARKYQQQSFIVVAGFISPYREHRQWGRERLDNFIEVFVDAPLEVCEDRDPKGMYKKARAGEIEFFTGITDAYERPKDPDIYLKTDQMSVEECVSKVMEYLKDRGFLTKIQ